MNIGIGVDVGGTHITAACIDFDTKQIIKETYCTIEIDNQSNALNLLASFKNTVNNSYELLKSKSGLKNAKLECIGYAFPGPFDYNKGISKIQGVKKYDNIFGLSLKPSISADFDDFNVNKISFLNDADCFLCGEYWLKDLSEYSTIVGITLGTGFGSSYIRKETQDAVFTQSLHTGYFYQTPFKESIADDYISTRWLLKRWKELTGKSVNGVKDIADLAETDKTAKELFTEFGNNLTEILLPKLEKLNAEMLVIGGNIAKANKYFLHVLTDKIKEKGLNTRIIISEETDKSALCGAAYWAKQKSEVGSQKSEVSNLSEIIAKEKIVIIEGNSLAEWENICENIERQLSDKNLNICWWSIEAGLEENEDMETKIRLLTNGSGLMSVYNTDYLKKIKPDKYADINIIYGCGALFSEWKGLVVYIDVPIKSEVLNNYKESIASKINFTINL
jgi:predicted NBD/HSP70 family sugar kinase